MDQVAAGRGSACSACSVASRLRQTRPTPARARPSGGLAGELALELLHCRLLASLVVLLLECLKLGGELPHLRVALLVAERDPVDGLSLLGGPGLERQLRA